MLLWAFYKLFLEKENIHFVKRFYLLFSLVFAFIIPLITLTYEVEVIVQSEIVSEITTPLLIAAKTEIIQESVDYLSIILWSIYGIGVLVFGFRFIRNIVVISKKIRTNERLKEPSHINVLLSSSIIPHTFLSYIFVPKKEFQNKNIPEEVLLHEKTHVLQKHTLDILFVEVLQVIFWFNPLFIFIKRSIKLNHEFLADHNVLKQRFSIQNYFELLLNYPNSSNQAVLSSPINYSLTKKRLQMMTKEFSKKRTMLKLITLVPVLSLCVLFFNNEIVAKEVERPLDEIIYPDAEEFNTLEKPSIIVLKNVEKTTASEITIQNSFQEGVTEEMVKEYNIWAKDLNSKINGNKQITIRKSDIDRMKYIYKNMTSDQRKGAEQFPDIPPPPPAPKVMKGEKSDIPPPPPPSEAPKVKKGEKSNIPPPPSPPAPIEENAPNHVSIKENWTKEEKAHLKEQVQNELARERAEVERGRAEIEREEAILRGEEAEKQQELASELAMLNAEEARRAAENAREIAMEASQEARLRARNQSRESMREAKMQTSKAEKEMRKAEMEARKNAMEVELEARKAMRKAEMQARKAEMEARKSARQVEMEARKAELQAMRVARNHSPDKLIERMAKNDADFYYNGKQISAKEALKLVEDSNKNLSIDASTKNGKSKVKLKD